MHSIRMMLSFADSRTALAFSKICSADMGDRGRVVNSEVDRSVCTVEISASDIVALRALANSVLRLAQAVEEESKFTV